MMFADDPAANWYQCISTQYFNYMPQPTRNDAAWQQYCMMMVILMVTGHNGHKPKRPQPKVPQTETVTNRNGHRPISTQYIFDKMHSFSLCPFRFVDVSVCGPLGLWPFRCVAFSVWGHFGLWPFGLWPFRLWPCKFWSFKFVSVMTRNHLDYDREI